MVHTKDRYNGIGSDNCVYQHKMNGWGDWRKITGAPVTKVWVTKSNMFGLGTDQRVYILDHRNNWSVLTSDEVRVTSFQVIENDIIARGTSKKIYKATLFDADTKNPKASDWKNLTGGSVTDFTVYGSLIYGMGYNKAVWKHNLDGQGDWKQVTRKGKVTQVAVIMDTIYGLGMDKAIWKYSSVKGNWDRITTGDVIQFALDTDYIHALHTDQAIWRAPLAGGPWTLMTRGSMTYMALPFFKYRSSNL